MPSTQAKLNWLITYKYWYRKGHMQVDIVVKLKNWKQWATGGQKIVLTEAVEEIEFLRKENEAFRNKLIQVLGFEDVVDYVHTSHAKMSEDKGQ